MFAINLGGVGEVPGVLNQQPLWAAEPTWFDPDGSTLLILLQTGIPFLLCSNEKLDLPDECADIVYTNNVPIDRTTYLGPGVQSSEIKRILKPGGQWIWDGRLVWTKP